MPKKRGASGTRPTSSSDDDAIIRAAAYERDDLTQVVIQFEQSSHSAVQSLLFQPISSMSGGAQFGNLTSLPIEVISTICMMLDAKSAFFFSHVSRRARETTATIPAFRRVAEHGSETLRAVLKTGYGPHLSVGDIDSALTSKECIVCKHFGCFFFIPEASRCCYECLRCEPDLGVMKLSDVPRILEESSTEVLKKSIPVLRTLPGTYRDVYHRTATKPRRRRVDIVSENKAIAYAAEKTVSDAEVLRKVYAYWRPSFDMTDAYRFMAATRLPYFDIEAGTADNGLCCKGCQESQQTAPAVATWTRDFKVRQRMFLRPEFLHHFASCPAAQERHRLMAETVS
ncbi:hypothetical protein PFICI_14612 [Pestalotiopsis fici W106-1]|uniref:F-box domain-containing protein n=1 Tax=Pestalotiopsis fici (strain W106-1 / CGMCC3.15140) TaxID=1229662 RepID=W3WLH3_PESFW|nr:uncharacterized protein PFICI_14612 [Pestalotiopsis fici W106-1]ETS73666.1 hypothetical protein PFICI_14612 [Pestalotiopsis fici W106-1]